MISYKMIRLSECIILIFDSWRPRWSILSTIYRWKWTCSTITCETSRLSYRLLQSCGLGFWNSQVLDEKNWYRTILCKVKWVSVADHFTSRVFIVWFQGALKLDSRTISARSNVFSLAYNRCLRSRLIIFRKMIRRVTAIQFRVNLFLDACSEVSTK